MRDTAETPYREPDRAMSARIPFWLHERLTAIMRRDALTWDETVAFALTHGLPAIEAMDVPPIERVWSGRRD